MTGSLWAGAAVIEGGGVTVGPFDAPDGVVWMDITSSHLDELREVLRGSPSVRWVQLPLAGVERVLDAGLFDHSRVWTSAKGVFAEPVAEHALALTLAGLRHFRARARATSWGEAAGTSLYDQPVTVVGGGGIAAALLKLLAPFRCEVTVVRRTPVPVPGARVTLGPEQLLESLAGASVVVLTLALTPQSRGIIGHEALAVMRGDAWLVNVARGGLVETEALVEALKGGTIGGAALDVTDPEPLPRGHPLWDLPNCLITPHTADTPEIVEKLLTRRIAENVRRFACGDELLGLVDVDLGY